MVDRLHTPRTVGRRQPVLGSLTTVDHRSGFAGLITDDGEAGRYAHRRGICVKDTVGMMREAAVSGLVPAGDGRSLLLAMEQTGRHLRGIPHSAEDLLR